MLTPLDTALDQVGLLCARTASSMGLIHTAYNTLSRILQRNPQNSTCLLLLCENYWKQNQQQQESNHAIVIDLLTKSLQHDTSLSNSSSPLLPGNIAKNGSLQTTQAQTNSSQINGPLSSNYMVWTYLAIAYFHTNQIDQSLKSITQATSLNPDEPFLWTLQTRIISRWYLLLTLDPQVQQQGTMPTIETLLPYFINSIEWSTAKRDPLMQLESHLSLASLYFQFSLYDQSLAEMTFALNLLDSIQSSIPLNEKLSKLTCIYTFIAILHQRLNDPNNALQLLQQVKDLAPTESHVIRCCIEMAQISLLSNYEPQIETSIALLTSELNILTNLKSFSADASSVVSSNEEFMLRYILARCHSHLGNTETSYYQFQQLLKIFINHDYSPLVWTSIASLYLQLDQLADSLQAYSQAVQIAMDKLNDPALLNATAEFSNVYLSLKFYKLFAGYGWFGISQVYSKTDQIKDSLNALEQSIELFRSGGDMATAQQLQQYYEQISSQPSSSLKKQNGTDHFFPPDIPIDLLLDFAVYNYMQSAFIVESLESPFLNAKIPGVDLQQNAPSQNPQSVSPPQLPTLQQQHQHQQPHGLQQQTLSHNDSPGLPRVVMSQPGNTPVAPNIAISSAVSPQPQPMLQTLPPHVHPQHPQHPQSMGVYTVPYVVQNSAFNPQPTTNGGPTPIPLGYIQHQQPQQPQITQARISQSRFA